MAAYCVVLCCVHATRPDAAKSLCMQGARTKGMPRSRPAPLPTLQGFGAASSQGLPENGADDAGAAAAATSPVQGKEQGGNGRPKSGASTCASASTQLNGGTGRRYASRVFPAGPGMSDDESARLGAKLQEAWQQLNERCDAAERVSDGSADGDGTGSEGEMSSEDGEDNSATSPGMAESQASGVVRRCTLSCTVSANRVQQLVLSCQRSMCNV